MNDFTPPPIVHEADNGLDYLKALCNLFDAPFDKIPKDRRVAALQLFAGLYVYPAIDNGDMRIKALEELDDLCHEYFPIPEHDGLWSAAKYGWQSGIAHSWGAQHPDVRAAYFSTRAEMIVYRSKWRKLTMGNPDDLITGYRWRRLVTGLIEATVGVVIAGSAYGVADGTAGKFLEGLLQKGGGGREAIRQGAARLRSGGSGVVQAATRGRGVSALATRGGAAGLLGLYTFGYMYAQLKDEEQDIRNAITLRVLNQELDNKYLDDINGPIDVLNDIAVEIWWEK